MTALSNAAQVVEEAAEAVLWDSNRASIAHLIAAVRHHDAEVVRALPLSGVEAGVRDAIANHIEPAPQADPYPEVEVRFAGGPTIRVGRFEVTADAANGQIAVEGFIATPAVRPPSGDAVRIDWLGIPGRGALADITARVDLFSRLEVLNIRIRTTIRPEVTP